MSCWPVYVALSLSISPVNLLSCMNSWSSLKEFWDDIHKFLPDTWLQLRWSWKVKLIHYSQVLLNYAFTYRYWPSFGPLFCLVFFLNTVFFLKNRYWGILCSLFHIFPDGQPLPFCSSLIAYIARKALLIAFVFPCEPKVSFLLFSIFLAFFLEIIATCWYISLLNSTRLIFLHICEIVWESMVNNEIYSIRSCSFAISEVLKVPYLWYIDGVKNISRFKWVVPNFLETFHQCSNWWLTSK